RKNQSCQSKNKSSLISPALDKKYSELLTYEQHASYLWYKGVSIEGISKRLGHKDVTITLHVYAHMVEEKNTEIENQIVSIMDTKSPEVPND
ncbi:hypothetical protein EFN38_08040, partial [Leuconostoc mesenteroides]|nr:hypothetical protein [Leuconostoc mesenteroides]